MSLLSVLCFLICSSVVLGQLSSITKALLGQYPYVVSIQNASDTLPNSHLCGGTILSPDWIITTAKCVYGSVPNSLNVVAGTVKLGSGGTTYKIDDIVVHEDYDPDSYDNDIALLRTSTSIAFPRLQLLGIDIGQIVSSIELETNIVPEGTTSVVSRTNIVPKGTTDVVSRTNIVPERTVDIPRWGETKWKLNFSPDNALETSFSSLVADKLKSCGPYKINNVRYCADKIVDATSNTCPGDSGGPLVSDGKIIGIVSYAVECNRPDLGVVYTKVATYADWIARNMKSM